MAIEILRKLLIPNGMSKIETFSSVINDYLPKNDQLKFLEIGVASGVTSKHLLDSHANATLFACDPFESYFDKPNRDHEETYYKYLKNLESYINSDRLYFERKSSIQYLIERNISGMFEFFDFVYIDGDHSAKAVLQDFILSLPLVKQGGIIAFDDYYWVPRSLRNAKRKDAKYQRLQAGPKISIDLISKLINDVRPIKVKNRDVRIFAKL